MHLAPGAQRHVQIQSPILATFLKSLKLWSRPSLGASFLSSSMTWSRWASRSISRNINLELSSLTERTLPATVKTGTLAHG